MATQRDQLAAYTFLVSRLNSALVHADADAPHPPLRRTFVGSLAGLALCLLAMAAMAVWALIFPGAPAGWRTDGTLTVDASTGARYIYRSGTLYPVLNYTSGLLADGGKAPVPVPDAALAAVPQGQSVGILGAPDAMPAPPRLSAGPWLVCAGTRVQSGSGTRPATTLELGGPPGSAADGHGLFVEAPSGDQYLVWDGVRSAVTAKWIPAALGLSGTPPLAVDYAFLNAVPAGPDLVLPAVGTLGARGPAVGGNSTTVGQVFELSEAGLPVRYFVMLHDGLAPLTGLGFDLMVNAPAVQQRVYGGAAVTAWQLQSLAGVPQSPDAAPVLAAGLPSTPPQAVAVPTGSAACMRVTFTAGGTRTRLVTAPVGDPPGRPPVSGPGITADVRDADAFAIAPGSGLLATATTSGGTLTGVTYLVTDQGVKYLVPSSAALADLGYRNAASVPVPTTLLALLPTGPGLDPAAAARPAGTTYAAGVPASQDTSS